MTKDVSKNSSLQEVSEKAMAPHSSTLACKIPWTEEPGGLPSVGSHGVGHDWSDIAAAATKKFMKFFVNVCTTCLAKWVSQSLEISENVF